MLLQMLGDDPRPNVERPARVEPHANVHLLALIKRRLRRKIGSHARQTQITPMMFLKMHAPWKFLAVIRAGRIRGAARRL